MQKVKTRFGVWGVSVTWVGVPHKVGNCTLTGQWSPWCMTVVHNDMYTNVSSSYSCLDWVLSYWAHFTVHRFICAYLCVFCAFLFSTAYMYYYCEHVQCFDTVGWVI